MNNVPCEYCESRYPVCHSSCHKYKEFQEMRIEISRKRTKYLSSRKWSDDGYNKFMSYQTKKS